MKIEPIMAFLPNTGKITDNDIFFSSVSNKFSEDFKNEYFLSSGKKALYAYKISSPTGNYLGIIAGNSIADIRDHHILPHEKTFADKEIHIQKLIYARKAQIKPVLCAFACPPDFRNLLADICNEGPPVLSIPFEGSNELHQLWEISSPSRMASLVSFFNHEVKDVYIADGHHRCAAVLRSYDEKKTRDYFPDNLLVILLPISDLKIYDYNRVVDIGQKITPELLLSKLEDLFVVKPLRNRVTKPRSMHLNMLLGQFWYNLAWKKDVLQEVNPDRPVLDAYLFNKYVLEHILGIDDERAENRITCVPGIYGTSGIKVMVNGLSTRAGFMLPRVKKSELVDISRRSHTMPPKSTWFEPRIKNGIIVLPLKKKSS